MRSHEQVYIGGRWQDSAGGTLIEVIGPATEEVVGRVRTASVKDIDTAVRAARRAFDHGPWPTSDRAERAAILRRLADAVLRRADEFSTLLATEAGQPVNGSASIPGAVARLTFYADLIERTPAEERRSGSAHEILVCREPVGVVAAILPWNSPLGIGFMKLAPALAAGCTIVVKTAPEAPLTWELITELLDDIGLPEGVVSVLCADREVSESLVRHPGVDKVSFTGSTAVGRKIGAVCGQQLKRCSLELGGKSAAIVLDDVNVAEILPALTRATTSNNGQACVLQSRLLVPQSRHDEIVDALAESFCSLQIGDPLDPRTRIGPLITAHHRERVEGYVTSGTAEGAAIVVGGSRPQQPSRGWFLQPTLFDNVTADMRIAREEIFGPVVSVLTYRDEQEALAMANASEYGLSGTVWSTARERALRIARQARTGNFGVNGFAMDVVAPFGGVKASGIGREMGPEGLEEYLEPKSIHIQRDWKADL